MRCASPRIFSAVTSLVPLTPQKHVPPSSSQGPSFLLFLPNISDKLDSIWYLQLLHNHPLPSPSSPSSSPTSSPPTLLPHLWILSSSAQLGPWKFLDSKKPDVYLPLRPHPLPPALVPTTRQGPRKFGTKHLTTSLLWKEEQSRARNTR